MKKVLLFVCIGSSTIIQSLPINIASGKLWRVPEAVTFNAIPENIPVSAPDVTFDVVSPFNFNAVNDTIGNWLASSSAFNIAENTPGTLAAQMDNFTTGSIVEFTGVVTVVNGQTFTVTHDDGLTLVIGGLDLGFNDGPTAPVTSLATYTGPSGTFPFQLVYAECCGGPAVLQIDLPFRSVNTPDGGSTLALLGLGVVGLAYARRKICA